MLRHKDNPVLSSADAGLLRSVAAQYEVIEGHWKELEHEFDRWPGALVHGDFVVKNLRVTHGDQGPELRVFDWEMAGWGVPATDLAQCLGKSVSPDLSAYAAAI